MFIKPYDLNPFRESSKTEQNKLKFFSYQHQYYRMDKIFFQNQQFFFKIKSNKYNWHLSFQGYIIKTRFQLFTLSLVPSGANAKNLFKDINNAINRIILSSLLLDNHQVF